MYIAKFSFRNGKYTYLSLATLCRSVMNNNIRNWRDEIFDTTRGFPKPLAAIKNAQTFAERVDIFSCKASINRLRNLSTIMAGYFLTHHPDKVNDGSGHQHHENTT